jgi:hypothetical protein
VRPELSYPLLDITDIFWYGNSVEDYFFLYHMCHLRFVLGLRNYINLNPSNAELNPTCHLPALLGAHHILHVSRVRVKYPTKMYSRLKVKILTVYHRILEVKARSLPFVVLSRLRLIMAENCRNT